VKAPGNCLWWISFADGTRPAGTQFLGACIVEAPTPEVATAFPIACLQAHFLGCNPGGEAQGMPLGPGAKERIAPRWLNRLLTRAECEAFDREHAPN